MKRYWVRLSIGCVVTALLLGCQVEEEKFPQPVELISPQDAAVFESEPPTFVWTSSENATDYLIKICRDSFPDGELLVQDTLEDTTYQMPDDVFYSSANGLFYWNVASMETDEILHWGVYRVFRKATVAEKTIPQLLYDSYFPMDTGYEWVYKRVEIGWAGSDDWIEGVYTIRLRVDSFTEFNNGWVTYHLNNDFYYDAGRQVATNGNEVIISEGKDTISTNSYRSRWEGDGYVIDLKREKGAGVLYQYQAQGYGAGTVFIDSLLYFRKGDTIWRYQ